MPRAILVLRLGLHECQELVAEVDEGRSFAAAAQREAEDFSEESQRLLDVADFKRDVIDADEAGEGGDHGLLPGFAGGAEPWPISRDAVLPLEGPIC